MTEFKQIIGRGTRVRRRLRQARTSTSSTTPARPPGCSPTPTFDGDPRSRGRSSRSTRTARSSKNARSRRPRRIPTISPRRSGRAGRSRRRARRPSRRKFYVDGGEVEIAAHLVYELDADGRQLALSPAHRLHGRQGAHAVPDRARRCAATGPTRTPRPRSSSGWRSGASTSTSSPRLSDSRTPTRSTSCAISPSTRRCAPAASGPSACEASSKDFFDRYGPEAREVLDELLEKYAEHGSAAVRAARRAGSARRSPSTATCIEIAACFGGGKQLRSAVDRAADACSTPPEL